jgi:hypothetical protein
MANPVLRLRFRVDKLPPGADLAESDREDAAFRVFIVFDKKDGLIVPNTIGYAWATSNEAGRFIRSDRTFLKNVWYVVLGQGDGRLGQWVEMDRDVVDDYRRAFRMRGDVPKVVAVGLKCDANDTRTEALSAIAQATLEPR